MRSRLLRGFGISLLLHGVILCSVVYVGMVLPYFTPPLVIDFSIENNRAQSEPSNASEKVAQADEEKANPKAPVKKNPPVGKPKQVERYMKKAVRKMPEKIATNKRQLVEKKAISAAVKPLPQTAPPQTQKEKIQATKEAFVEPSSKLSAAGKDPFTPQKVTVSGTQAAIGVQSTISSPKERYIQANFSYIRDTVKLNTSYPDIARRMGWEGKVLVAFTVCVDGRVEDVRVIISSGFPALDKNAIKTIKRCVPFPKPPVQVEVTLPIIFKLT